MPDDYIRYHSPLTTMPARTIDIGGPPSEIEARYCERPNGYARQLRSGFLDRLLDTRLVFGTLDAAKALFVRYN